MGEPSWDAACLALLYERRSFEFHLRWGFGGETEMVVWLSLVVVSLVGTKICGWSWTLGSFLPPFPFVCPFSTTGVGCLVGAFLLPWVSLEAALASFGPARVTDA